MKKFLLSVLLALGFVVPAHAQQAASALILSACGTLPTGVTYAAGQYGIQTMDTSGKSCSGATFSGSVSATTAATSASTLPTLSPSASSPIYESLGAGLYVQPVFGSATGGGTQVDATHGLPTNCIAGCAGGTQPNNADGVAAVSTGLGQTQDYPFLFNGTTFDRWRGDLTNGAFVNVKTSVLPAGAATSANQTNATQKTQIVDGSGNVIASTSNNLDVQCANCSGSGVSTADQATFTAGTSLFAGTGGFFQTTVTSNPLTTGKQGMWQMTAYRAGMVNNRDSTGAENIGTTADTAWVSGSGSIISIAKTIANNTGAAIPAGSNQIGTVTPDPCATAVKVNFPIATSSGNAQIVGGSAAKKVYLCSLSLIAAATAVVNVIEGTGAACTTANEAAVIGSTTAASGMSLAANGGLTLGNGGGTVGVTATAANGLCILQSGTTALAGNATYVQQ